MSSLSVFRQPHGLNMAIPQNRFPRSQGRSVRTSSLSVTVAKARWHGGGEALLVQAFWNSSDAASWWRNTTSTSYRSPGNLYGTTCLSGELDRLVDGVRQDECPQGGLLMVTAMSLVSSFLSWSSDRPAASALSTSIFHVQRVLPDAFVQYRFELDIRRNKSAVLQSCLGRQNSIPRPGAPSRRRQLVRHADC